MQESGDMIHNKKCVVALIGKMKDNELNPYKTEFTTEKFINEPLFSHCNNIGKTQYNQ